jgi:hypothetical protein
MERKMAQEEKWVLFSMRERFRIVLDFESDIAFCPGKSLLHRS